MSKVLIILLRVFLLLCGVVVFFGAAVFGLEHATILNGSEMLLVLVVHFAGFAVMLTAIHVEGV